MTAIKKKQEGAALIIVLVIISVVASLIVSLLTMTRHEVKVSNYQLKATEARLAAKAGFQDACGLLTYLTVDDDYFLSTVYRENTEGSAGDGLRARYTYITKLDSGGGKQYPLFSGGKVEDVPKVSISATDTADLLESSPVVPAVRFDSSVGSFINTFGLSWDNEGNLEAETTAPLVGQIEMDSNPADKFVQKYSFWVEDLEGYPNLDVVNGGLNDLGEFEYKFLANGIQDSRVNKTFELGSGGASIFFPETEYGQDQYGAIAPGLSPREMFVYPWEFLGSYKHPYSDLEKVLSVPDSLSYGGNRLAVSPATENRFVQGLLPYYTEPKVPFLHDYENEGEPKFQLNEFIANFEGLASGAQHNEVLRMKQWITDNLPQFENRKGGFPEDYVATICASMIDYADDDQEPTYYKADSRSLTDLDIPSGSKPVQGSVFPQDADYRGVDSYLPVNEFFYRLEAVLVNKDTAVFKLNPFVEFWNPFHVDVEVSNLQANCYFVENYGFKALNADFFLASEGIDAPKKNDPLAGVPAFTVPANGYRVVNLGDIEWRFDFEYPPGSAEDPVKITFLGTPRYGKDLSAGHKDGKLQLQLMINGKVIDQSGRPFDVNSSSAGNLRVEGYHIPRISGGTGGIISGDFWMNTFNPANERVADQNGTFLGDVWMSYYGVGHANLIGSSSGTISKSTPGSRNLYTHNSGVLLKTQTSVRNWPDRGFDDDSGSSPSNLNFSPDTFVSGAIPVAGRAPLKISDQGRYFSTMELGNIHDPVMWAVLPKDESVSDSKIKSWVNSNTKHNYELFGGVTEKNNPLWFYPKTDNEAFAAVVGPDTVALTHGGGNTLRIGRKEHPLFDEPGMRACQLLDLFQSGCNGTNLPLADYGEYTSAHHFLPATALTEDEADDSPFADLYPPYVNGSSRLRRVYGLLNINSAPTVFEIENLLRAPFSTSELIADEDDNAGKEFYGVLATKAAGEADYFPLDHTIAPEKITEIAEGLIKARPFVSQSHLARVLSELIHRTGATPLFPNDAILEETTARVLNMTHFTSRHFRIFSRGEVVAKATRETIARSTWVHEVAMYRQRDPETGEPGDVRCRVLSSREL